MVVYGWMLIRTRPPHSRRCLLSPCPELPIPYYDKDGITIYHGDCREILPQLPKVDLVLTDPPYGVGIDYGEAQPADLPDHIEWLAESCLPIFRSAARVVAITPGIVNLSKWRGADWCLAWTWKHTGTTGKWGFNQWGPILVWGTDPMLSAGKGRHPDVVRCSGDEPLPAGHPCPKPIRAWKKILSRLSLDSQTILDPFMGSGTTLVAAKQLGRKSIGIEIEEKYCDIAIERLAQGVLPLTKEEVPA